MENDKMSDKKFSSWSGKLTLVARLEMLDSCSSCETFLLLKSDKVS